MLSIPAGTVARKSLERYDGAVSGGPNMPLQDIVFPGKDGYDSSRARKAKIEAYSLLTGRKFKRSKNIRQFILGREPSLSILTVVRWDVSIA